MTSAEREAPFPNYPHETLESMAEIGEAFMDAMPKDYSWCLSPSEVIAHLQNEADDARASHAALVACLSAAVAVLRASGDPDARQLIADSNAAIAAAELVSP